MEALSPPRRPRPTTPDSRGRDRDRKESKFAGEAITNVLAQHQQQEAARRDDERRQKLKQREHARAAAMNPYDKLLENQQAEWMRKKDRRSAVISRGRWASAISPFRMAIYLDVMACNQICDKLNSGLFRSAEIRVSSPHLSG